MKTKHEKTLNIQRCDYISNIHTYDFGDGFYVDLVDYTDYHTSPIKSYLEAWVYHKDYGIKEFMFRMDEEYNTFFEYVKINFPAYRDAYVFRVMKDD